MTKQRISRKCTTSSERCATTVFLRFDEHSCPSTRGRRSERLHERWFWSPLYLIAPIVGGIIAGLALAAAPCWLIIAVFT